MLVVLASAAFGKLDDFFEYVAPFSSAAKFCLLATLAMLPIIVISSLSVALFVVFRGVENQFGKALVRSLVVILPFAAAVWVYDTHVQWRIMTHSVQTMWNIQVGTPEREVDAATFVNFNASTSNTSMIHHRIDSLQNAYAEDVKLGYGDNSEAFYTLAKYRYETIKRNINSIYLIVSSLLFASLGYWTRRTSVGRVVVIIAVVVVCVYVASWVADVAKHYTSQPDTVIKEIT